MNLALFLGNVKQGAISFLWGQCVSYQEQAKEIMNVFLKQKFGGHNVSFMISEDNVGYSFEVRYIDSNGAMSSLLGNFYVDKLTGLIFDAVLGDRVYDDN